MLSFKPVASAEQAAHYFESSDDYYGSDSENTQDGPELAMPPSSAGAGAGGGAGGAEQSEANAPHAEPSPKRGHKGVWAGEGAAALGLRGTVDREVFKQLLNGQLPDGTIVRKGKTAASKDRKGIDFTFSAPKSVSIHALLHGDKKVIEAHDRAVVASLRQLELHAMTRKKKNGKSYRENTQKLVIATFRHELSRAQDPQLHTHSLVMNMTQRSDGEWRALSNEDMLRNVKVVGAFYRAHLASELRTMGYELRETPKGGWELAHVSDKAIDLFSSRSKDIERLLKARGQDRESATTGQKQILTLASRPRKTDVDRAVLRNYWLETARQAGVQLEPHQESFKQAVRRTWDRAVDAVSERLNGTTKSSKAADGAIDFAIEHLRERQGIFTRGEVLTVAYGRAATMSSTEEVDKALERAKQSGRLVSELPLYQTARSLNSSVARLEADPASAAFKDFQDYEKLTRASWVALTMHIRGKDQDGAAAMVDEAIRRGALVPAEERYTTAEARQHEIQVLAIEKAGRGVVPALVASDKTEALIASAHLNDGQADAVRMILGTTDRFVGVQGLAGTGKSHMLRPAIEGITASVANTATENGYKVVGLAPYASQVKALNELGVEAQTVASFLTRKALHRQLDERAVVLLDEGSVVPAYQMANLMSLVERTGARMVIIGDKKQTQAVEAGKPFEQLLDAGMRTAYLSEIQRQKDPRLKAAVVHAASDRVGASVNLLRPDTVSISDNFVRHSAIAGDYASLSAEQRERALIVAGTNAARRSINELVRRELGLDEQGQAVAVLEPVDMTRAELRSAGRFREGQVVVPEINYKNGLSKGVQYEVLHVDFKRNILHVRDPEGKELSFDPRLSSTLSVHEHQRIALAKDEPVTFTRNEKELGIRRGDRYKVLDVEDRKVVLENAEGRRLELSRDHALHLRYGYTSTVTSAQGLTSDRVFIEADTLSLTANRAVYYVAISRPRHGVKIYTDNEDRLAMAMSREPKKYAALELRDERNEAFFLKGKLDGAARAKLAAALQAPRSEADNRAKSNVLQR